MIIKNKTRLNRSIDYKYLSDWCRKNTVLIFFIMLGGGLYYWFLGGPQTPSTELKLTGEIESGFHYKLSAIYSATRDVFWCKGGENEYFYYPAIKNGKHNIDVPLNEFSSKGGCLYRLSSISIIYSPESVQLRKPIFRGRTFLLLNYQHHNTGQVNYSPMLKSDTTEERELFCFQTDNKPDSKWICRKKIKDGDIQWKRPSVTLNWTYYPRSPAFVYDSSENKDLDLMLNIKTISYAQGRALCFNPRASDFGRRCRYHK